MTSRGLALAGALAMALAASIAACHGCPGARPGPSAPPDKPSVRLVLLSTIAGALEPCGCSKDQLGGLDHVAALVRDGRAGAAASLVLAAGPLLFIDAKLDPKSAQQEQWKAEAIAEVMKHMGLWAWAPGLNDWAAGDGRQAELGLASGAHVLTSGHPPFVGRAEYYAGSLKVGIVGVSDPRGPGGRYPEGRTPVAEGELLAAVKREVAASRAAGARLLVVLAALERGAALRIADRIPELHVLLVGRPHFAGHANTEAVPPEISGTTLVVETPNHAQGVAVVDVFVQPGDKDPLVLADAGGVESAAHVAELARRIRELEHRINGWEKGGKVDAADVAARKADLERLRAERTAAEQAQAAQVPTGSFFRYRLVEVREALGKEDAVVARMAAYYRRVNDHNKVALADLRPEEAAKGEARYIGVDACTDCHQEERDVWDKTAHARAYRTLVEGFKEFNLECVGCHVTGYGKRGGSTVTHNQKLRDVGCEECHGPGSLHAADPDNDKLIVLEPDPKACVDACHHPPHVEGFDPVAKMELVLGPGHGK